MAATTDQRLMVLAISAGLLTPLMEMTPVMLNVWGAILWAPLIVGVVLFVIWFAALVALAVRREWRAMWIFPVTLLLMLISAPFGLLGYGCYLGGDCP